MPRSEKSPLTRGDEFGAKRQRKRDYIMTSNKNLQFFSKQLRNNMTDSEIALWSRLRKKQILNIQFYRQKPIGNYIVDFYAPAIKLVVEIDGSQHYEVVGKLADEKRDTFLKEQGLNVMRFDSAQVLRELEHVVDYIYNYAERMLRKFI